MICISGLAVKGTAVPWIRTRYEARLDGQAPPHLPVKLFENLLAARRQVTDLQTWPIGANQAHRHSACRSGPFDFLALVHQHFAGPRWAYSI